MHTTHLVASVAIALLHTLGTPMASAAPAIVPMSPTGPWNVEFADSMCILSRSYGNDRATNLIFKPGIVGDDVEIIVMKATRSISSSRFGNTVLTVGDKTIAGKVAFSAYSTKTMRLLRIQAGNKIALATVNGSLSIDAGREGIHSFVVQGIGRALPVVSDCVKQLRAVYKINETELSAISTWPSGDLPSLFSTNDYPAQALLKNLSGTVGVLLWVAPDGRISTCEVIESSASPILESTTCSILQRRARLTPAKDAAGNAVRAPSFTRVRWILPF